jgi:hypothetical protein
VINVRKDAKQSVSKETREVVTVLRFPLKISPSSFALHGSALRADVIGPRGSEGTCLGTAQLAEKELAQAAMPHGDPPEGAEKNFYEWKRRRGT